MQHPLFRYCTQEPHEDGKSTHDRLFIFLLHDPTMPAIIILIPWWKDPYFLTLCVPTTLLLINELYNVSLWTCSFEWILIDFSSFTLITYRSCTITATAWKTFGPSSQHIVPVLLRILDLRLHWCKTTPRPSLSLTSPYRTCKSLYNPLTTRERRIHNKSKF